MPGIFPEVYDVSVKVISQEGKCDLNHKVGEEWIITDRTPGGLCLGAAQVIYPEARVLKFGGAFPWTPDKDVVRVACPDIENPVLFEVRRIRK